MGRLPGRYRDEVATKSCPGPRLVIFVKTMCPAGNPVATWGRKCVFFGAAGEAGAAPWSCLMNPRPRVWDQRGGGRRSADRGDL